MLYVHTVFQVSLALTGPPVSPDPIDAMPLVATDRAPALLPAPELIHPALWRAHQLGRPHGNVRATGFAALDVLLPGGGWPKQALTELLLPHPGVGELRLLAPALAALARAPAGQARHVMLIDPPARLCAWAWAQMGLDSSQLLVLRGRDDLRAQGQTPAQTPRQTPGPARPGQRHWLAADLLWALEQALKSGHLGAVLAWLPDRLPGDALRRLQLAAQGQDGLVFLLRGIEARLKPSAAPLRLALHGAGPDELALHILKCRGPTPGQALRLALPAVLPEALRGRFSVPVQAECADADAATAARPRQVAPAAQGAPPWAMADGV